MRDLFYEFMIIFSVIGLFSRLIWKFWVFFKIGAKKLGESADDYQSGDESFYGNYSHSDSSDPEYFVHTQPNGKRKIYYKDSSSSMPESREPFKGMKLPEGWDELPGYRTLGQKIKDGRSVEEKHKYEGLKDLLDRYPECRKQWEDPEYRLPDGYDKERYYVYFPRPTNVRRRLF